MRKLTSHIFGVIIIFCGCTQGRSDVAEYYVDVVSDVVRVNDLDPFVDSASIVHIEQDLSMPSKMLITNEGNYIVEDKNRIFMLDSCGTTIPLTINRGRARNEYLSILDICCSDSTLFILDTKRIREYSLSDGSFVCNRDIESNLPFDAIAPGRNNLYLYSAFSNNYKNNKKKSDDLLYLIDEAGDIINSFVKRSDCTISLWNITQSSGNTYFLKPQNNANIFYQLKETGPFPKYKLYFGRDNVPKRYYYTSCGEKLEKFIESDYYKLPHSCYECTNYVSFSAVGPGGSDIKIIYDTNTRKGIMWENELEDGDLRFLTSDQRCLYMIPVLGKEQGKHGPLFNYLMTHYPEVKFDGTYIVKISFRSI